jgi:excisionase family DNA binding protein
MESGADFQSCGILYVDDEERSLKYFELAFRDEFRVLTASNAAAAYDLLLQHKHEIAVLLADQRMPGEKGLDFLERVRQLHPDAVRILTTAYSDTDLIMQALNSSCVSKLVTKPWNVSQLQTVLKDACALYREQRERNVTAEFEVIRPKRSQSLYRVRHLLTVDEVARYLKVDKFTVYRLITQEKLPAFKVGNQWRFKQELIDAWLERKSNLRD